MASPPVCKVMDYGKYRYEQEQKAKEARKRQTTISIKEIKLRPKIDDHDFDTKKGHVERFLKKGDKVKLTIMFRGRELVHPHLGERLLRRMAEDLAEIGEIESEPNLDGRNMIMMLAPKRTLIRGGAVKTNPRRRLEPAAVCGGPRSYETKGTKCPRTRRTRERRSASG